MQAHWRRKQSHFFARILVLWRLENNKINPVTKVRIMNHSNFPVDVVMNWSVVIQIWTIVARFPHGCDNVNPFIIAQVHPTTSFLSQKVITTFLVERYYCANVILALFGENSTWIANPASTASIIRSAQSRTISNFWKPIIPDWGSRLRSRSCAINNCLITLIRN